MSVRMMTMELLDQKAFIEGYLGQEKSPLSTLSFPNIFLWKDFFHFDLQVIDGSLCIFARDTLGCFLYLPPLGPDVSLGTIETCFDRMRRENRGNGISRIENVTEDRLPLFPPQRFSFFKKDYEYCYYRKDIAGLRGNTYKSKRSSYNQFQKNHAYQYLPYQEEMRQECERLYQEWAAVRARCFAGDAIYLQMLEENARVHGLALQYAKELGLVGRVVLVEGKLRAYTFGFEVNPDVFCVLFEVADLKASGLPVFIFKEFCDDPTVRGYRFINVMDDFAMEGVRRTKMSFAPSLLWASYTVSQNYDECVE